MRASLLLVLGLLNFASAIWFEVPLGVQKCLREDLSPEVLVKGYFNVTPIWGSSNLRVTVRAHCLVGKIFARKLHTITSFYTHIFKSLSDLTHADI
jgi:hypothetical protein